VLTISQLHFEPVPGRARSGSVQLAPPSLLSQTEQLLTSKNPSPSPSTQGAVSPLTGRMAVPLTSPQTSPSWGLGRAKGSMTALRQSALVEASGSAPMKKPTS